MMNKTRQSVAVHLWMVAAMKFKYVHHASTMYSVPGCVEIVERIVGIGIIVKS